MEPASILSGSAASAAVASAKKISVAAARDALVRLIIRQRRLVGGRRALRTGIFLEQLEGPQRPAGRYSRQARVAGFQRIDAADPTGDGDVLLAVLFPSDGLADDAGRGLELPQELSGLGIEGHEFSRQLSGEDEAA